MSERQVEHGNSVAQKDFSSLSRTDKKARLANVLERGLTNDRLIVDLPPEVYGEWVPRDPSEIARMQSMGFEIDTKYASARALHGSGSGESVVGDVIFMTAPSEVKEIIDELRMEQYVKMNGNPNRDKRTVQREESEGATTHGLPIINESSESGITGQEIGAQLFSQS